MKQVNKARIVIVGAGFGGLRCALELNKRMSGSDNEIILVDKHPYHLITPALYQVAAAETSCRSVSIPFKKILETTGIIFIKDKIESIDSEQRVAKLSNRDLHYDVLVMALGSQTDYYGIPGLKEHSISLKSIYDGGKIRLGLQQLFKNDRSAPKRIIVGGGGFTGCELVGELVLAVETLGDKYGIPRENIEVAVVEGADQLLPGLPLKVAIRVNNRLERLGVKIYTGCRIEKVDQEKLSLSTGENLEYDMIIWTGGVRAGDVNINKYIKKNRRNCITVDQNLQCGPREFVIGDLAFCEEPKSGKPLPGTIPIAVQEGKAAAINAERIISGRPLKAFRPKHSGYLIPLTGKYAIAMFELPGKPVISGRISFLMFQLVLFRYFLTILPFRKAIGYWRNWNSDVNKIHAARELYQR